MALLMSNIRSRIPKSPEVLFCNGSVIGTLGNFSASTGKAKSKKTFNVSAILAAALTNEGGVAHAEFLHHLLLGEQNLLCRADHGGKKLGFDSCGCTYQWRGFALYRRVSR